MYPLTGDICIKMQERFIHEYQRWDHTGSIKSTHLQAYEKERQSSVRRKRNILEQPKCLQEEIGNFFCKRSNDKSRHSTIYYPGDSFLSSAIKGWPERNSCSEERNLRQKWLEIRFKFAQKVFRKSAMCKIEIWNHQKESRSQFT